MKSLNYKCFFFLKKKRQRGNKIKNIKSPDVYFLKEK